MKSITRVRCIWPFTRLSLQNEGHCYSCCPSWTNLGNVGNLTIQNSLMDVWNNEKMQYLRKIVLEDRLEETCNFKYCPFAIKSEYYDLESMKNEDERHNQALDQIMAGKTILDKPPYALEIANSGKCNLRCVMCQANDEFLKYDEQLDQRVFTKIIPEVLPDISRLLLSSNGEVFFNPHSVKFLQSLDAKAYPSLLIQLYTNGTLFTPKLWESIRHNRYDSIFVSIDAASKETYQRIRKRGNWDVLRRNLDFISELRRQKVFYYFSINFIVMKSNYHEMADFVKLGKELNCDKILFQRIFGDVKVDENINLTMNKKILVEIAENLKDPIFNYPGVDTIHIDEYRNYTGQDVSLLDTLVTKGKERFYPSRSKRCV